MKCKNVATQSYNTPYLLFDPMENSILRNLYLAATLAKLQ